MKSKPTSSLPIIATEETSLAEKDIVRLEQLEKVVKEGLPYFIAVGLALKEINEKRYYKKYSKTFPEYMESRFGYSSARGYQLIHSAEAAVVVDYGGDYDNYLHAEKLNHGRGNDIIIDNERKARALYGLEPEEQKAAAKAAQEKAIKERKTLSYKDIDIAASERRKREIKGAGKDRFVDDCKHIAQSLGRIGEAIKEIITKYSGRKVKNREVRIHIRKLEGIASRLEYTPPLEKKKESKTATPNMYADTKTWSPFMGCKFGCTYCLTSFQLQAKRQKHRCTECYNYTPHFHPDRLSKIPAKNTIFVCGNADIAFASARQITQIIDAINNYNKKHPTNGKTFYLQSKRPSCIKPFLALLPRNVIILTTLETNRNKNYSKVSKAPVPSERYKQFLALDYPRKVVTIEPIMDFDVDKFSKWILTLKPEYVWLGFNSRKKPVLPEPPEAKMRAFTDTLIKNKISVRGKTLRGMDLPGVERMQG